MNQSEQDRRSEQEDRRSEELVRPPSDSTHAFSEEIETCQHADAADKNRVKNADENAAKKQNLLRLPPELGRYRVEAQLDEGGFGTVYLGHDDELDRKVAIKAPRHSKTDAAEFLKEARRLAQLRHPGIVTVYDVCHDVESCFIVTEFVDGKNLAEVLGKGGVDWVKAVDIIACVADALAHAHANGMIHRDIKPGNIILRSDGSPVVLDFGLALTDLDFTAPDGLVKGTPAYMAPEQARGQAHRVDGRTDIFSLALVLYELLTGRRVFRADNVHELLRRVIEDDPQPLRQLSPAVPPAIAAACEKAMAKRMEDRFTTAGDFATALRAGVTGPGVPQGSQGQAVTAVHPLPQPPSESPSQVRERRRGAERRHVSIAIFNFEATSAEGSIDAEDQHEISCSFRRLVSECIEEYGGTVVKNAGKEVTVCYGYPTAYEYAAHRAILSAMSLRRSAEAAWIAGQKELFDCQLTVWVVVHSGDVVVEDAGGEALDGISLSGKARDVIASLDWVAEPNTVSISASTHRLVEGFFNCDSLPPQRVRGVAEPVSLYRVLGETSRSTRIDLAKPECRSELIGRATELSILKDRWEQALEGLGQVVLLKGDAGLGKSRLIRELCDHVTRADEQQAATAVEIRCSPYHQSAGYFAIIEYFQQLLAIDQCATDAEQLERVVDHLKTLQLDGPERIAALASLLNIDVGETYAAPAMTPQRQKELTEEFLVEWLEAAARQNPILFVVEDLHWVDPSTLEVLTRYVERRGDDQLLTLLTCRPEFETPWHNLSHLSQIALNRLTKNQISRLLRNRLGRDDVSELLVSQVVQRTDGVPLFIEEYAKLIEETGLLDQSQTPTESVILQVIPDTLQDLLLARLDRHDSNPEVVRLAATIGREFTYELMTLVTDLSDQELQIELDKLVDSELLFQKGRVPNATYTFKHALIQDAAYSSLLKKDRHDHHRRIAEALAQNFPNIVETQPELLALHFTRGGETEQAIRHWLLAGQRSQSRSANVEAISQLESGLQLVETMPESQERDVYELEFRLPLIASVMGARGYSAPEVESMLTRSRDLCEKLGGESPIFAVMWGTWAWRFIREELSLCQDLANEFLAFAKGRDDRQMLSEAYFTTGLTHFYRGQFPAALSQCRQGVDLFDLEQSVYYSQFTNQNSGVITRAYVAMSLCYMGCLDQALDAIESAQQLADELQHPFSSACEAYLNGFALLQLGDLDRATEKANQAIQISDEQVFPFWKGLGLLCRGGSSTMRQDYASAIADLREGIHIVKETGAAITLAQYQGYLALAEWRSDERDQAQRDLELGLDQVDKLGGRWCLPWLLCVQAEFQADGGRETHADAESTFRRALDTATEQQAKLPQLYCAIRLFRFLESIERGDEVFEILSQIYATFDEGLSTSECRAARAIIEARH